MDGHWTNSIYKLCFHIQDLPQQGGLAERGDGKHHHFVFSSPKKEGKIKMDKRGYERGIMRVKKE